MSGKMPHGARADVGVQVADMEDSEAIETLWENCPMQWYFAGPAHDRHFAARAHKVLPA